MFPPMPDRCPCCGEQIEWHASVGADGTVSWLALDPADGIDHVASCATNPFTRPRHRPVAARRHETEIA